MGDLDLVALLSAGAVAKTAPVLLEKISNAVGVWYEPKRIVKQARAQVESAIIEAETQIKITEMQKRAASRLLVEEERKQENMESVVKKALPSLDDSAKPEDMDDDWIVQFFEKCRLVSDEEMQKLWASVLAGEANAPGSYSKRTLTVIADLEKEDARLFEALCGFCVKEDGQKRPLIYDSSDQIYGRRGLDFERLQHLEDIGLVRHGGLGGFILKGEALKTLLIAYAGDRFLVSLPDKAKGQFDVGEVLFTDEGKQIASLCNIQFYNDFIGYLTEMWKKKGYEVQALS